MNSKFVLKHTDSNVEKFKAKKHSQSNSIHNMLNQMWLLID